ncbi:hypothetical protein ESY86_17205 [Subsaximicrobium wynnwilliamsii]|uniref:Lipocalin-like domain-containing protein n=1 Tax=Subsaximicrobium wynnwilliamsii TaxID=291179 RepID=A0A5C6ZBM2_9FLAO|nr:lipocalin family protein [Subsaximicrobium wynnwilliamsii]TXD83307.1 hypothetical protein ESY87_10075 [Subsaximicrobium wynnwilliamsii]TXD87406.1 hypothetical protein ESY86_17205 [Subsaximicrobium wynnwilliamsii]TXE03330.1 hypothetical protein ESY88_08370 [Subsaximicrobium wynnwilliamsii]
MKISFTKIASALLCLVLFTAVACENESFEGDFNTDGVAGCEVASLNTTQAALNFTGANIDNYALVCPNYKSALQAQILACNDANGNLQAILDTLGDCTEFTQPDDCATATAAVGVTQSAFSNATAENYTQLCNAYKAALENLIVQCGNDGGTQSEIEALGDCFNSNQPNAEVEGTWKLTAWMGENPIDLNNDAQESTNFLDEIDCYTDETLVFNAGGTGVSMSTSYANFDVQLETDSTNTYDYTVDCIAEVENTDFTWTQSGNSLTLIIAEQSYNYTIDGNSLSTLVPNGFTVSNADATITVTEDLTFVFTKQ